MPTKTEREYYRMGFADGMRSQSGVPMLPVYDQAEQLEVSRKYLPKPKRKLSAWNKYIKANAKKPRFRLRSGSPNLKKLGVAYRKTPAGRKKKRR